MPQVTVWECPKTKKLFKHQKQYKKHLKVLARESLDTKARQKLVDSRLEAFKTMRETCKNAAEIEQFVKDNVKVFWAHACHQSAFHTEDPIPDDLECISYKIEAVHKDMVSNSHQCPLNGGVTNWGGDKPGAAKGYPGFHGRVRFEFSHDVPGFSSGMWKNTGLETGTGGGGHKSASYDIFMFDVDWPGLSNRIEEAKSEYDAGRKIASDEYAEKYKAAQDKYQAEYPAKKAQWEKDRMEEVLRGSRENVPKYDNIWQHQFSYPKFRYPNFVAKL